MPSHLFARRRQLDPWADPDADQKRSRRAKEHDRAAAPGGPPGEDSRGRREPSGDRHDASDKGAAAALSQWADGPFSAPVNEMLSESFGRPLDGIDVKRGEGATNARLGAEAHTIGRQISLGDHIKEDPEDPHSMEVIAHEVAHALADDGARTDFIDRKGDPGEAAADQASDSFRSYVAGGAQGSSPPSLAPAHGGQAAIHRFEAGEHADAVDNAVNTLQKAELDGRTTTKVDPKVAAQMAQMVTLANGLQVAPGQITAMMGDFYGAFDKGEDGKEHFNAQKSFDALNNADPKEMTAILDKVEKERAQVEAKRADDSKTFTPSDSGDLEAITKNREVHTDADGTTSGYSFLELAQRNTAHFTKENEDGTDNNMGAYSALHELAMKAAADGDQNTALAMEASSQHFLTDRFASGHQFNKDNVIDEGGGGIRGNIVSRMVHNDLNDNGVEFQDQGGAQWKGFGDGHWADAADSENREHAAQATYDSYAELNKAATQGASPADGLAAKASVPVYDDAREKEIEAKAGAITNTDIAKTEATEAPGALYGAGMRQVGLAQNWMGKNLPTVTAGANSALDFTKREGGALWDWLMK